MSQVPAKLRDLPPTARHQVVNRRRFEFKKELNDIWVVNEKIFDVEKSAVDVKRGTAEIWELNGWMCSSASGTSPAGTSCAATPSPTRTTP